MADFVFTTATTLLLTWTLLTSSQAAVRHNVQVVGSPFGTADFVRPFGKCEPIHEIYGASDPYAIEACNAKPELQAKKETEQSEGRLTVGDRSERTAREKTEKLIFRAFLSTKM